MYKLDQLQDEKAKILLNQMNYYQNMPFRENKF